MYENEPVSERMKQMRALVRDRVIWVGAEQANIMTEVDKECGAMLPYLKIAKYIKAVCERKTLRVEDFEMLVGNREDAFCSAGINPLWEGGSNWIVSVENGNWDYHEEDDAYHTKPGAPIHMAMKKQDFEDLKKVREYWSGKTMNDIAAASAIPESFHEICRTGGSVCSPMLPYILGTAGHMTPGFQYLVNTGYGAIRKQAQDWLDEHYNFIMGDDADKYMFYTAVVDVCDGMITMVHRYGDLCSEKAAACTDPKRKAELERMSADLHHIATEPCEHYRQALQAVLLYQQLIYIQYVIDTGSMGRVDQYAGHLLEKDLANGEITIEEAQELCDCYFLKLNTFYPGGEGPMAAITGIGSTYLHNTIGGVDPDTGEDATTTMTYMVLASISRLELHDPPISLRINKNTPDELWDAAFECNRRIGGLPLFQNDEVIIPAMQKEMEFSLHDARDYAIIGCQEITGQGTEYACCDGVTPPNINLHYSTCLAMALNDGCNPFNGEQSRLHTGFLYDMKDIEEVKQAWYDMSYYIFKAVISFNNYIEYIIQHYSPFFSISLFLEGCMESGLDCTWGGAKYNSYGGTATGLATVADSFSAIKYMCFDNDYCTLRELYDALQDNWVGHDELRQRIIKEAPHFGNNDPEADAMMDYVTNAYYEMCETFYSKRAKKFRAGLYGASDHVAQGYTTPATPDGRANPDPIADAASPVQARDFNGPTAVLTSSLHYHQEHFIDGVALNIKIHPNVLSREDGKAKLRDMTKAYLDNGGLEVQYNIVSTDQMREAQKHPDDYRDMVVRIAGYSAYFVELNTDQQNDLIARTENVI